MSRDAVLLVTFGFKDLLQVLYELEYLSSWSLLCHILATQLIVQNG